MIYTYGSIRFREPRAEDAAFFQRCMNENAHTQRCLFGWVNGLVTMESEQEYLQERIHGKSSELYYCIENSEGRLIGSCSIFDLDARTRKCTVGLYIADPQARGKGHGGDALELLLLIAFTELNCRKVKLHVYSFNENAIRLYEKKGFAREGVLKDEVFTMGKWHDEYCYALFDEDWLARVHTEQRKETI